MKERWSYSTWVLTLEDYPVFVYKLFNSNLLTHKCSILPHFPSFNNFKMIKIPQNFLIKLNLWWDYSLVHAQRKKFAQSGEGRGSSFLTNIPFLRSPASFFCLTLLF